MVGRHLIPLTLALAISGSAQAYELPSPVTNPVLLTTITAQPTAAYVDFCARQPRECEVDTTEPLRITLNDLSWTLIQAVNQKTNREIEPISDQDHWGVADRWDFPADGLGDCEDIQLEKRRMLVAAGLPKRALRMAVVIDEEGAGHAVLIVNTDRGEFVLDNRRKAVLPWTKTGYRFVKRETGTGKGWAYYDRPAVQTASVK